MVRGRGRDLRLLLQLLLLLLLPELLLRLTTAESEEPSSYHFTVWDTLALYRPTQVNSLINFKAARKVNTL